VAGKKEAASLQRAAWSNACNKSRGAPQENLTHQWDPDALPRG